MTPVFDAHCHLCAAWDDAHELTPPDQPVAVCGRLLCGVSPGEFAALERAARLWPGTRLAFGVHPWYAGEVAGDWQDAVAAALARSPSTWVGEIGLDGLKTDKAAPAIQDAVFRAQLRLAKRFDRPVNLHCVKEWDALVSALDAEYLSDGPRPFIVHSFAGPYQVVAALTERGAFFSIGQLAARKDTRKGRERAALVPADRLLLESDSFILPCRDDTEELSHALDWLAAVRSMSRETLAGVVVDNSLRLFGAGEHQGYSA